MRSKSQEDAQAHLDPEVAALVEQCRAADEARNSQASAPPWWRDWGDGKPTEFKLALGPMALLCIGAGILSAIGGLVVFGWAEADALDLLVSQLPSAGLITLAFARSQGKAR